MVAGDVLPYAALRRTEKRLGDLKMSDNPTMFISVFPRGNELHVRTGEYQHEKETVFMEIVCGSSNVGFHSMTLEQIRRLADRLYEAADKVQGGIRKAEMPVSSR